MATEMNNILPCGDGWCVETPFGMEGPLESSFDAAKYASLLKIVSAARSEMVCQESDCL